VPQQQYRNDVHLSMCWIHSWWRFSVCSCSTKQLGKSWLHTTCQGNLTAALLVQQPDLNCRPRLYHNGGFSPCGFIPYIVFVFWCCRLSWLVYVICSSCRCYAEFKGAPTAISHRWFFLRVADLFPEVTIFLTMS
jgi:hypothetical protein